jgi:uncharacterized protein YkwD
MRVASVLATLATLTAGCVIDPSQGTAGDSNQAVTKGDAGTPDAHDAGDAGKDAGDAGVHDAGDAGDAGKDAGASTTTTTTTLAWLPHLNTYRTMAGLPALTEDAAMTAGDKVHAKYIVQTGTIVHAEDKASKYYTAAGDTAGQASNVAGGTALYASNDVIDSWMAAPFHAVGLLDPRLQKIGFGEYYDATAKPLRYGAALDVVHGRVSVAAAKATYPVMFPGDKQIVPLHVGVTELPSPLTACKNYSAPFGLPIVLQLGSGTTIPKVTGSTLQANGRNVDVCTFDETTYVNPVSSSQVEVRSVLNTRNAIVLVPRDPLIPGTTYRVTVQATGKTYTWTFAVASKVTD